MDLFQSLLFGFVVLITHFIEGITGFGCTVLALPFCTSLAGIKTAVPVLVVIAWLLALYIMILDFRKIVWKEFIKIVSFVIIGLPIGMWLFGNLPEAVLKKLLGVFMILIAVRGLYVTFKAKPVTACEGTEACPAMAYGNGIKGPQKYLLDFVLFLGGVVHGAFGSGGPFVVIYAVRALPDKSSFRATICALWFTLNSIIIFNNARQGLMTGPVIELIIWVLPFLAVGMVLGNYAHRRVKGAFFIKLVYSVLLLSGVFMFF